MSGNTPLILVTGASGFIGSNLVKRLVERGFKVRALLRKTSSTERLDELGLSNVEIIRGDVTDINSVRTAVKRCEYVFNIAGVVRHGTPKKLVWAVNSSAAGIVADACADEKVKQLIHCSTVYVTGLPKQRLADELCEMNPAHEYGKSKAEGERLVLDAKKRGLNVTVIRPAPTLGPGDTGNLLKIFKMVRRGIFPMIGSGKNIFQTVYVENLIDAFEIVLGNEKAYDQVFNVLDEEVSLEKFLLKIAKVMERKVRFIRFPYWLMSIAVNIFDLFSFTGVNMPMTKSRLMFMTKDFSYSTQKIRSLGWKPNVGLETALKTTVLWYKSKGLV